MGTLDEPSTHGERRGFDAVDAEVPKTPSDAHDVDDAVDGTYFMEVHVFNSDTMNVGFGTGECIKGFEGKFFGRFRKFTAGNN